MINPTRNALSREAAIAAEHLGSGATIIGKANYAHDAHYSQAFFSISAGIERGAKLALAVNHAIANGGDFPDPKALRAYGHNLSGLLCAMDKLSEDLGLPQDKRLPVNKINNGIVEVLTEFASNITRYYNLDFIMGNVHSRAQGDPIELWYKLVTKPILEKHLTDKRKNKIEKKARRIPGLMEPISHAVHIKNNLNAFLTCQSSLPFSIIKTHI